MIDKDKQLELLKRNKFLVMNFPFRSFIDLTDETSTSYYKQGDKFYALISDKKATRIGEFGIEDVESEVKSASIFNLDTGKLNSKLDFIKK